MFRLHSLWPLALCVAIFAFVETAFASSPHESLLYSFQGYNTANGQDGANPTSDLISDEQGNLYGTTFGGGMCLLGHHESSPCGIVFELSPPTSTGGAWTETILYEFGTNFGDGSDPNSSLLRDKHGNLYGTTFYNVNIEGQGGCGTFFELSPPSQEGGAWTETILYNFGPEATNGCGPFGNLVSDSKGNIFGVTQAGGGTGKTNDTGGVFELSPPVTSGGAWTESFTQSLGTGYSPSSGLIMDTEGNLYGATAGNSGTVYELTPPSAPGGAWVGTTLYSFLGGSDGSAPNAALTFGGNRTLYGTTSQGGAGDYGTVFKLSPPQVGSLWSKTTLYAFQGADDGRNPGGKMRFDESGSLIGSTVYGGGSAACPAAFQGCGTIFRLSHNHGTWSEQVIYRFQNSPTDGAYPSGLLRDQDTFYGTAYNGGTVSPYYFGAVFAIEE
jgi:uncharacterized repeat protein (TIGR03803 family)